MVTTATDFLHFSIRGRTSGDDLVSFLSAERGLDGWWLCYNADATLLAASG